MTGFEVNKKQFINLLNTPYSRRGSYIAFANDNLGENVFGKSNLWLCNCRTVGFAMNDMATPNGYRQVHLQAVKNGFVLQSVINTTPYEVILETIEGSIHFCIGEKKLVMAYSDSGLTLRVTPTPKRFNSTALGMRDPLNRQLIEFKMSRLLLTPVIGTLSVKPTFLEFAPNEQGILQGAFEDFILDPDLRPLEDYPTYDECVANVKTEFDTFCETIMPELPEEFEDFRLQALWHTWNMMVDPDDENDYKRTMVKMVHSHFEQAFVWQMPMQAVWLSKDPALSWEIFCSSFEFQDKHGRLLDAVPFIVVPNTTALKPPVQGLSLLWMMEHGVIDAANPPLEDKKWLLERLIKWTEFYYNYRDIDHDGICEYHRRLETGWEDAPHYQMGMPQASPDLNALLALQLEAIAKFGATVGMPEEEQKSYLSRSKQLIDKIVEKFWDGERWFAICLDTGARSDSNNVSLQIPLVLGKRLPADVIEKTIANLFREGGFNCSFGMTSEAMDSKYFRGGFTSGSIITPTHFLMPMALEACGRHDLAKEIAVKYCRTLKRNGFFHIYNPFSGDADRSLTAYGERGLFWSAWTSSCYLFLASQYGGE